MERRGPDVVSDSSFQWQHLDRTQSDIFGLRPDRSFIGESAPPTANNSDNQNLLVCCKNAETCEVAESSKPGDAISCLPSCYYGYEYTTYSRHLRVDLVLGRDPDCATVLLGREYNTRKKNVLGCS
jgi:hypothetical protein